MNSGVPTDIRGGVRILLRPRGASELPAQIRLGSYVAAVVGEAQSANWSGIEVQQGDLEAIVWTTLRQVPAVCAQIKRVRDVVDARPLGT
ncbi:MAG: hypothetical protein ACXWUG_31970 [Polyangiales bacterium]